MARNMCTSRASRARPAYPGRLLSTASTPACTHTAGGTSIRSAGSSPLGCQEASAWPDVRHKADPAPANKSPAALVTRHAAGLPARRGGRAPFALPNSSRSSRTDEWRETYHGTHLDDQPRRARLTCPRHLQLPKLRFRHHQEPSRGQRRSQGTL
jgi:hypothetical protein